MKKKIKKLNNVNNTLGELLGWLDDRGFNNTHEALEFIEDSLSNVAVRIIISEVEHNYNAMEKCICKGNCKIK